MFSEKGEIDDGLFVDRVFSIAQTHSDVAKHEVEFVRYEHTPRLVTPREFPPPPGLRDTELNLVANPLNDSYV